MTHTSTIRNIRLTKKIIPIILFAMLISAVRGQADEKSRGKITGRIVDHANNETLIGVPVLVEGTTLGATTDLDGKYLIENVPAGNHNLVVRYVGYSNKIVTNVMVEDSKVANVDVAMELSVQNIKEVTITSEMRRESVGSILLMQKKSNTLQDGISSEAIKKTSDKNTGEVIRRISGTSVQEGKFVLVRGLNDRYNNAMLNGVPLSSTEPDRKAFSFDLFPSSLIDNLIVIKAALPEVTGDFAGGLIQVNTKEIPDKKFLNISVGTGLNTQSTMKAYETGAGGKKDWLGTDDGTRDLPADFPSSDALKKATQAEKINYSKLLPNDWKIQSKSKAPLGQSYQVATGFNSKVLGNDFGMIAALNYLNSEKTLFVDRSDFDFDASQNYQYQDKQYNRNVALGGLLNATYKVNNNNKLSLKNLYSANSLNQVILRNGKDLENLQNIRSNAIKFSSTRFMNSALIGEHYLPSSESKIKWYGSATNVSQEVPDLRSMYYYRNNDGSSEDTTTYYAYVPFGNASPNYAGKFYSRLNEDVYNGEVSINLPLKFLGTNQFVKTGYLEQFKSREFNARVLGYVVTNPAQFNYSLLTQTQDSLFLPENMGTRGFRIDEITNPSDHYTGSSNLHAGYIQFDNKVTTDLRVVWGIRVENFIQKLNSIGYSNDTIRVRANYLDVLPSTNVTYSLTENTNLRFAASRTVARPEFRELAPFGFYDFSTSTSVKGNDSLKATNILNLDLRYELFPSSGQVLSASVFYKHFEHPIEPIVESSGAGSRTVSFANAPSAYVYGIEFEARKNLDFLQRITSWSQWDNMTLFGNISFMRSRVDKSSDLRATEDRALQGQSPYVLNAGLGYADPLSGLALNVVFNRIGKRIYQVGNSSYLSIEEAPRNLLDLQLSKKVFKQGEIKINMNDVLNNDGVFYQDQNKNGKYDKDLDSQISRYQYGINYSLTISYNF
jgi:outer membrane receptor protein involved in Fe transport